MWYELVDAASDVVQNEHSVQSLFKMAEDELEYLDATGVLTLY